LRLSQKTKYILPQSTQRVSQSAQSNIIKEYELSVLCDILRVLCGKKNYKTASGFKFCFKILFTIFNLIKS